MPIRNPSVGQVHADETSNWRRWSFIAIASVVSESYLVMPGQAYAQPQPPANEVRALWVVRSTLTSPEKNSQDDRECSGRGIQ
jgi:hypothetical protein